MSVQNANHATDKWNKEIQREKKEWKYPKWPNEVMLKMLFGGSPTSILLSNNGEEFFFCDSERYLQHYCEQVFETVGTGRSTEKLIKLPLDFLIALCR